MSVTNSSPLEVAKAASISSRSLAVLSAQARNNALTSIHQTLAGAKEEILAANARDVELATKAAADGNLSQSILKRLDLARKGKWEDMLQGILDVRDLEDPGENPIKSILRKLRRSSSAVRSGHEYFFAWGSLGNWISKINKFIHHGSA